MFYAEHNPTATTTTTTNHYTTGLEFQQQSETTLGQQQQQHHRLRQEETTINNGNQILLRAETSSITVTSDVEESKHMIHDIDIDEAQEEEEEEPTTTTTTTTTTLTTTTKTNLQQQQCKDKLDELERRWDARRDARIQKIQRASSREWYDESTFDLFEPEAVCIDEERFGSGGDLDDDNLKQGRRYHAWGDGPKYLCGVDRLIQKAKTTTRQQQPPPNGSDGNCLVYSVGSNNNVDFEMAISNIVGGGGGGGGTTDGNKKELSCEIHTFDPTIQPTMFVGHEYTTFHDWGFGQDGKYSRIMNDHGTFTFDAISIEGAMKKLGHQGRTIDILKIDCEGCEFVVLTQALEAMAAAPTSGNDNGNGQQQNLLKIDQIQVEIHGGALHKNEIIQLFQAADNANMRVFHKERNGWGCQGYKCIEYSFVHNDLLRKVTTDYVC